MNPQEDKNSGESQQTLRDRPVIEEDPTKNQRTAEISRTSGDTRTEATPPSQLIEPEENQQFPEEEGSPLKKKHSFFDSFSRRSGNSAKRQRVRSFWRRLVVDISLLFYKLKSAANEALSSDEVVSDMFDKQTEITSLPSLPETESADYIESKRMTNISLVQALQSSKFKHKIDNEDITYKNLDVVLLREELVKASPDESFLDGELLFDLRRAKWLQCSEEKRIEVSKRIIDNNINQVPRESYDILYKKLVDDNQRLKRPINLRDLIKIVNAGWISSQRWERAAHGLG